MSDVGASDMRTRSVGNGLRRRLNCTGYPAMEEEPAEAPLAEAAACPSCDEVVRSTDRRVSSNGVVYHAECWDRSQRDARERLIHGMWPRRAPTCLWCLARASGVALQATVWASADPVFRKVFDRSVGTCPECRNTSVLIHPASSRGDAPRMSA
jgi:hypothetical protein